MRASSANGRTDQAVRPPTYPVTKWRRSMDDPRTDRIAGWAGIVFSVLSLIVLPLILSLPPPLGSSGAAFAAWYGEHRLGFLIGNYLGVAAFFPGLVQLAVLAARVRQREGATGWLSSLVLATGTFTYAVFACS